METLHPSIPTIDALHLHIAQELGRAEDAPSLSEAEALESEQTRLLFMRSLNSAIDVVKMTLQSNQISYEACKAQEPFVITEITTEPIVSYSPGITVLSNAETDIMELISPDGLKRTQMTPEQMADSIEPVIRSFDDVLRKPYLANYNASLNTAPVVGIKGDQVWYVETKTGTGSALDYSWSHFCDLPPEAKSMSNKNYFLFPYNGDFHLAVGQMVWRKSQRWGQDDRKKAINRWPSLYNDNWDKVGNTVLPAADLRSVVSFPKPSADKMSTSTYIVVLKSDSTMAALIGNDLTSSTLRALDLKTETSTVVPKWSRITYWNNQIVATDNTNAIYEIKVDCAAGNYTFSNKEPEAPITELTASDIGVVVARDGYLYRNTVAVSEDSSTIAMTWERWIPQHGVTNLGVASPGAMLDLRLLTSILRNHYLHVQSSLGRVMLRIQSFCNVHTSYVKQLQRASETYKSKESPEEKADFAIEQGDIFIRHSRAWSRIIHDTIVGCYDQVVGMTGQLKAVHEDLRTQLSQMEIKLSGLQKYLNEQKEALSKANTLFWVLAGATLFGGIFVGAGAGYQYSKKSDLEASVAGIESAMRDVNTGHSELNAVFESYKGLDDKYDILKMFWGRMNSDASEIHDKDEGVRGMMGERILKENHFVYNDVLEATDAMLVACDKYLEVLQRQSIPIIDGVYIQDSVLLATAGDQSDTRVEVSIKDLGAQFYQLVDAAKNQLDAQDLSGYSSTMEQALAVIA